MITRKPYRVLMGALLMAQTLFAASTIQFPTRTLTVAETIGQAELAVVRVDDLDTEVAVDFFSIDATATAGQDYTPVNGTLTFAAGETNRMIMVPILNDGLVEGIERFQVALTNATSGTVLGSMKVATVTIQDNDRGLQFELASYSANEDAGEVFIRVLRGDDGDVPVSVDYATRSVTALAGEDYLETAGTLTFQPDETVKRVTIPLLNDAVPEAGERLELVLSNPAGGGALGSPQLATISISDTDELVQFGAADFVTLEDAAWAQIEVIRGENASATTVELATLAGTATDGLDYAGITSTLEFKAGQRLRRIDIPILNDVVKEATEAFSLALSNPGTNAALGPLRTASVSIFDNDPGIGFERTSYEVWENWVSARVNVIRGNDQQPGPFTVDYVTSDGTARAGMDYEAVSGTLEFETNATIRSISVPIRRTAVPGPAKSFTVTLSNPSGGLSLGTAVTRIDIHNAFPGSSHQILPAFNAQLGLSKGDTVNVLSWEQHGALSRADEIGGPWEEVVGAQSPYATQPLSPAGFYRVLSARPTSVYVPSVYDGGTPLPLVVALHGLGGDAAGLEAYLGFQRLAETRGFLLCYPEGVFDRQGWRFWDATEACCDFYGAEEDDSTYLRGVIEEVAGLFAVDRKRIHVTGYSNGGFMSHRMACDHADLVASIASLAGMSFLEPDGHPTSQPVHVLHIHGTADEIVPYWGGALISLPVTALFPSAVATVENWARLNGCQDRVVDPTPSMDLVVQRPGLDTTVMRYANSPSGGSVELWTINGGTHEPTLTSEFSERVIDWLLAHPKP